MPPISFEVVLEELLVCIPVGFGIALNQPFTGVYGYIFVIGILLSTFGRTQSQGRFQKQLKYSLFFRRFSEDGFIYPIVMLPLIVLQLDGYNRGQLDIEFISMTNASACALFGIYLCFNVWIFIGTSMGLFMFLMPYVLANSAFIAVLLGIIFTTLFIALVRCFPNSFTFGEASLIVQTTCLIAFQFIRDLHSYYNRTIVDYQTEYSQFVLILMTSTIFTIAAISPILYCKKKWCLSESDKWIASICFYIGLILNVCIIFIPSMVYLMKKDPLDWLITIIVFNKSFRIYLIVYWSVLVLFALIIVYWFSTGHKNIPKTIVRKIFHGIAFLIFAPLYYDREFFAVITTIVFVLFIGIELLREFDVKPFSKILSRYLEPFREQQDSGSLILTHIYLLAGFSIPIWLSITYQKPGMFSMLSIYAGVLSLGVGDTFASLFGKRYGKRTWPNRNKTYVGTAGCFTSMLIVGTLGAFCLEGILNLKQFALLVLICLLVSILEGISNQVDNMILPAYTFLLCKTFSNF